MGVNRLDTIRINELPETTILSDSDIMIHENDTTTHKVTLATLSEFIKKYIDTLLLFIRRSEINSSDGVAPLDENKKILSENINFGKSNGQVYEGSEGKALETSVNTHILDNTIHITEERINITLTDYYKKADTYSKTEVQNLIGNISSLNISVVDILPTEDISTITLYLVPNALAKSENIYDEYVYANNEWELIGSTQADLTNYYNKTEIDEKFDMITEVNSSTEPTNSEEGTYWVQEYE